MSNDDLRITNFQTRATALYQAYGEIDDLEGTIQAEVQETVEAILWAIAYGGEAYDPRNEAAWNLSRTRLRIDNLASSVRAAIQGALVEAEGVWGGMDEAPQAYRGSFRDLRDLQTDLRILKAAIDRTCAEVDAISK